jgi:hypothetical protein
MSVSSAWIGAGIVPIAGRILILLLALQCTSVPPAPAGYDEALREVRSNERSPRGDMYLRTIEKEIRPPFERAIRRCFVSAPPETLGTRFLFRLDASGVPVETFVHPQTPYAECIRQAIGTLELEPPPEPNYWIGYSIHASSGRGSIPRNSPMSGRINW